MFDAIEASNSIKNEYISYITTSFHISDKDYAEKFKKELEKENVIAKGPYLDISDSFETGKSLNDMMANGVVSSLFTELESNLSEENKEIKLLRPLYKHQEKAIEKINNNKNIVVTTGTGSGKTECFILPILNHLLKEKEKGHLNNGVRAILIYPMNALANDQMKRLRKILSNYPDITFGVYNGNTKSKEEDGIAEYGKLFKDENGRPLKPLKNEIVSREKMQACPPHILVTNYSMLEYMLLRPNDDLVFSGSKLKFLVLDEAHIYRGATGIETSFLLRRLKARISDPKNVCHILTSATLGGKEADNEIIHFAETLCDTTFNADDIIRSTVVMPTLPEKTIDVPNEVFEELANPTKSIESVFEKYNIDIDIHQNKESIFYDLCIATKTYRVLRKYVTQPMTINELVVEMNKEISITGLDLVNFIHVASQAQKNKSVLLKARYHMFIKALEGAFITLTEKNISLERQSKIILNGNSLVGFEATVCDECGRLGITGKVHNNILEYSSDRNDEKTEVYLLKLHDEKFDLYDDEDDLLSDDINKDDYIICAECGEIHHVSLKNEFKCGHNSMNLVNIRKAERKGVRNNFRCPCCNIGNFKRFNIGYDAATAVLGTELFEQLPESETVVSVTKPKVDKNNIFAKAVMQDKPQEVITKTKQFLTFSDSRSEAAFFASYMENYYKEFLRRRGIYHIIEKNKEDIKKSPWEVSTLVNELTAYFDSNRTFANPGQKGNENLTPESRRQAWIAVLNEMVNARRSTSLVSLGILDFAYKGNEKNIMENVASECNKNYEDVKNIFDLLAMDIVTNGAIEIENNEITLTDDQREYIYYTVSPRRFKLCKELEDKNYISGWLPRARGNNKYFKNGRVKRISSFFGSSESDARNLLDDYWKGILTGGEHSLKPDENDEYYFSTNQFLVVVGDDDTHPIYRCDTCGKVTMSNIEDKCVLLKCNGHLNKIPQLSLIKDNHYANLYSSDRMKPLFIKEHTAQLSKEEQQTYQEEFVKKEINALSCSTTFEMGVDVGDLETVYLRNVPPTPANYVQRAGRAGRSISSAAYALTFCKLSSHDFTYFKNPDRMISGKIGVPIFNINNKKIIYRHMYAVALSQFFALNEDVYNANNADVFLNQDGYQRFKDYLNSKPKDLLDILKKSISDEGLQKEMGIYDWSWVNVLIEKDGVLENAVNEYKQTIKWYEDEIKKYNKLQDNVSAGKCEQQLKNFRKSESDQKGKNELIEFLTRNNVLPKYGFPVDTVELYQGGIPSATKKLQMVRDLQIAIAEYAPGSQVVADGKIFTSRYIRKLPKKTGVDWKEIYIAECGDERCKTWNYRITPPSSEGEKCISCGEIISKGKWVSAIEPRRGFTAESKTPEVSLNKPDRSYKSEDYYIGDVTHTVIDKKTFKLDNDEKIKIETTSNDSLMVRCLDHFMVCDVCGYSVSFSDCSVEKKFNKNLKKYSKEHYAPWGKKCDGELRRKDLCHTFKTDVIRITFGTVRAKNQATMLSVMYALLEAVAVVLNVERNDIKGCLHKIRYNRSLIYEIVLYDAVAGGAGYVRRLTNDNCMVLQNVIKEAINITKNCTCKPSCYKCLRNYYNQSVHDVLNREAAYEFLENYVGNMAAINEDEFEQTYTQNNDGIYKENQIKFEEGSSIYNDYSWKEIMDTFIPDGTETIFEKISENGIKEPTDTYGKIIVGKSKTNATTYLFRWENEKILIFDDDISKVEIEGWNSFNVSEISIEKFKKSFTERTN